MSETPQVQVGKYEKFIELPSLHYWGEGKWRDKASCKGMETNTFFPTKEKSGNKGLPVNVALSKARLICAGCTVRQECLDFALQNGLQFGLYGGVPPRDRRSTSIKAMDGSMSFKTIVSDLHRVRKYEPGEHPHTFIDELATILRRGSEEVKNMLASKEDIRVYTT